MQFGGGVKGDIHTTNQETHMQTIKHISEELTLKNIWNMTKKGSLWVYETIGKSLQEAN